MGLYPPPDTPLQLWLTQSATAQCSVGGLQASPPGARGTVTHLELSGDLSRCGSSTVNSLAEQGPA